MSISKEIQQLVERSRNFQSMKQTVENCITLDEKITLNDALRGFSAYERTIYNGLEYEKYNNENQLEVVLAFRPHGRMFIVNSDFFELNKSSLCLVGRYSISSHLNLSACMAEKQELIELELWREEIVEYLFKNNSLDVGTEIAEALKHMAPLIFYIGKNCYSNFYGIGRSEYIREFELNNALLEVVNLRVNASIEALTLTYCLKLLFISGGYTRPEEMNSGQLTILTLKRHFKILAFRYQEVCDISDEDIHNFLESSLYVQAMLLSQYRNKALLLGLFVRDIHGINLLKKERFIRRWSSDSATQKLIQHAQSLALIEDAASGLVSTEFFLSPHLFNKGLLLKSKVACDLGFSSDFELLIDSLIQKSIQATQSDIGMTRGTRSFFHFLRLLNSKDTATACKWTQSEYFCHAVPSVQLIKKFPPKKIAILLNSVSSRMRYNTWHYAPSYFDWSTIPPERGWFHAPKMPDIAQWSDQHHVGHIHASTRHCIRSPQTIFTGNRSLAGFIDLRLMRQGGVKYSMTDLVTAIAYTDALTLLYQALMDSASACATDFRFSFGDKQWIDTRYLSRIEEF